ncbi:MAG: InlB B-repeat-containing protein [Faecalibacterium prausnitzii]
MKHCAKKLLGLAFALALCLAVGGTALAQTPEFADVLAALPEQEMLAYEPNVAMAEDTTTIGDIATNGYQVTIPTTVTVESGENKGELEVNAKLKQYRTLNIGIESPNNWKLKYDAKGAAIANAPTVEYTLKNKIEAGGEHTPGGMWHYDESTHEIMYATSAVTDFHTATIPLSVNVTDPSQATMSGTYSDTLTFTFDLVKQCVTYTINVYEQKLEINNRNNTPHVTATNRVDDATGQLTDANSKPKETYVLEYGCANAWGMPLETAVTSEVWTRPRPDGTEGEEDTRCWEDLSRTLTPKADFEANHKTQTINLNLVRKWYWLDVNGIVGYDGTLKHKTDGNQLAADGVGCYLDIHVSVDEKNSWSEWFSYKNGDDYWGTFPYGTNFEIGFYNPKPGYLYDTDEEGNVKVIANGNDDCTTEDRTVDGKAYKIFKGQLIDEPQEADTRPTGGDGNFHAPGNCQRYCFNPCFRNDTIIYYENNGTEDSVTKEYKETDVLPEYDALFNGSTHADMKFAGWSTKQKPTSKTELYQPGTPVTQVNWGTTATPKHFYAIWGYDITVQFEDEKGYSTNDGTGPVATRGGTMVGYSFTLEKQVVADGADWTLDLTDPKVTKAIDKATTEAKRAAGDNRATTTSDDVWKTDIEYKLSAAEVKNGKPLVIKRRRYLLSVISALTDTGSVLKVGKNPEIDEYGTFKIIVNGGSIPHLSNNDTSFYQQGLNYGASYTVSDPKPLNDTFVYSDYVILQSLAAGNKLGSEVTQDNIEKTTSYSSHVTGKKNNVHYYKPGDLDPEPVYTGDPVRVAFWEKTTTATPGPNRAPAKKALTLRYHANFDPMEEVALDLDPNPLLEDMDDTFGFDPDPLPEDVDDALEEAVKTVRYQPGEDVVLRNCMFKRGGYVFVGWNTEPDGTGKKYEVNGVPITDWAAGDTVDLYAQWKKPEHLKPVVDNEPFVPTDPDTPPEWVDDGFDADFGADPDPLPEGMDDAFGVDPAAQPEALDDAFGIDPDPLPEELDDAFGV